MEKMHRGFWGEIWRQFLKHRLGVIALSVVFLFILAAIYAPFLASNKPIVVIYDGTIYFPLFRYLFYSGFYTKFIDIFFNLLILIFPLSITVYFLFRTKPKFLKIGLILLFFIQIALFIYFAFLTRKDPDENPVLNWIKQKRILEGTLDETWSGNLQYMNSYARLNLIVEYIIKKREDERLEKSVGITYRENEIKKWIQSQLSAEKNKFPQLTEEEIKKKLQLSVPESVIEIPSEWNLDRENEKILIDYLKTTENGEQRIEFIQDKNRWLKNQAKKVSFLLMPLIRPYHWEEYKGLGQSLNPYVGWLDLTRPNGKDLAAALIFGARISLIVGFLAVGISLLIGIPFGSLAGYYGGKLDIILYRIIEIWESMPVFFMLLLVVGLFQSKSIFLVIAIIGVFSWTGFSRFIRGEFFKQRNLPYVEACRSLGFSNRYIIFSHILPNAIPPLLTLLPFAIMGAITSEAGLSFLGLGEENSCSWGVLMDEGRKAFPGESYLLWPPAILLTILLIAIAMVGDTLRDCFDPKLHLI